MRRPLISVRGVTVKSGPVLLDAVDWTVNEGERWVILGANGSGKTTLLNVLAGYRTFSDGALGVLGETYGRSDWRALRRRVGLVSVSLGQRVEPGETALEVVASGADSSLNLWGRVPEKRVKAAKACLRRVELLEAADRPWAVLSQGERQRALIGRSLMARFELLLLDEPCAGLDPVARQGFVVFLSRLASARSPGLVLVTHHLDEIPKNFSHGLVLADGRVLAQGTLERVLTSDVLSRAFKARVRVASNADGWTMRVPGRRAL